LEENAIFAVTIIEIRPFRNRWKCFEAPGVEPVFLDQEQAINYAKSRACFRSGEIRVLDCDGTVQRSIPFTEKIEDCDGAKIDGELS
jgi:hypothetical protein